MAKALISANTRRSAREFMVGWTLGQIQDAFHDHGFAADLSHAPDVGGARRTLVEQFYFNIDWGDREQVRRVLEVFEALLDAAERHENQDAYAAAAPWSDEFIRLLARDGVHRDSFGRLRPRWVTLGTPALSGLPAESSIPILLSRMWDSVEDDPDAAIGAAKEAVEATAKHLLTSANELVSPAEKMSSLIARVQKLLGVHASSVAPSREGADTIKGILGSLSQTALGINDLRRDYGTGHGRPLRPSGLRPRHARLAAQAADAWVTFMLDTWSARAPHQPAGQAKNGPDETAAG